MDNFTPEQQELQSTLTEIIQKSPANGEQCLSVLTEMTASAYLNKGAMIMENDNSPMMKALYESMKQVISEMPEEDVPENIKSKLAELEGIVKGDSTDGKPPAIAILNSQVIGSHKHKTVLVSQHIAIDGTRVEDAEKVARDMANNQTAQPIELAKFKEASVLLENNPEEVFEWLLAHGYVNTTGVDLTNHTTIHGDN